MLQRYVNRRKRGSFLLSVDPDLHYAGKRKFLLPVLIQRTSTAHWFGLQAL
jgi:hypothetical protein